MADGNATLYNQLIKLGDMMGDGLHHEPDGKWISKEYKRISIELGLTEKEDRSSRNAKINDRMAKRVTDVRCSKCNDGILKQTRSGSKRAKCESCGAMWQLLK